MYQKKYFKHTILNLKIIKVLQTYYFDIGGKNIPVSAHSLQEAQEILQAYIDKRSLDWTINKCQSLNSK